MGASVFRASAMALAVLALSGCSQQSDPEPTPTQEESTPTASPTVDESATSESAVLNTHVPVAPGLERTWPEPIATVAEGGQEFSLLGVHRIDDERVIVTGRIAGIYDSKAAASWFEPGYFHSWGGYEFSRVAVIADDGVRHLPVRDDEDRCLCSLSTHPYDGLTDPEAAAWVVVSAPEGASEVDVEVIDLGTIEGVTITDLPAQTSVPFGWEEVLAIDPLVRQDGVITARATLANVGDTDPSYTYGQHKFSYFDAAAQNCFQGLAAWGDSEQTGRMASDEDCQRFGGMPPAGKQVTLEVKVADPGTDEVLILPDAGLPITVGASGSPSVGPAESMRTYSSRTERAGALVDEGERLTVNLDTSVLFDIAKSTLTSDAEDALDVATQALQSQDSRDLLIAGHTDSVGSEEENMVLSEQRAKAVAEALKEKLGPGWDITIEWHGESRPVAAESGSETEVDAARARNRRVEITVQ